MPVEWAWLPERRSAAPEGREIVLTGGDSGYFLLFHGLTGSPAEFAYVANYLHHRKGCSVWCPRLVNHGQPLGTLARTGWQELEDGARACFDRALAESTRSGLPLFVGGLSLGAVLSLIIAADHSAQMGAALCLAPTLFYDGWNVPWTHRLIPAVSHLPLRHFAYFREEEPYGLKDEVLRRRIGEQFGRMSVRDERQGGDIGYAHFPVRLFCEIRHLFDRCIRRLTNVSCPVLLVQARNDDITGPENSQFIYRHVGSKVKEIVMLENSYHVVTMDLEREKVADSMARFCLSGRERAPADPRAAASLPPG
jgi:carboxylesterase